MINLSCKGEAKKVSVFQNDVFISQKLEYIPLNFYLAEKSSSTDYFSSILSIKWINVAITNGLLRKARGSSWSARVLVSSSS